MRNINDSTTNNVEITRPTVELCKYEDGSYTYEVDLGNATYRRAKKFDEKSAKEAMKAFKDAFNGIAAEIECGGRKRFIMDELGLVRQWNPQTRAYEDTEESLFKTIKIQKRMNEAVNSI